MRRSGAAPRKALILSAALLGWLTPSVSRAQFGYGWWWGGYQTPSSVTYLNQRAQLGQQAAAAARPQPLRAPVRTGRDATFFERYDVGTRSAIEERVARRPSRPATPTPAPASTTRPGRPIIALASFFNDYDQIVWPRDTPNEGELKDKRAISEAASLGVLKESRSRGVARIATVTDARNKLLDYGHPALDLLRSRATAGIVETVQNFLNSLYFALGDAATTQTRPAGP
jgi:hypothetical protein